MDYEEMNKLQMEPSRYIDINSEDMEYNVTCNPMENIRMYEKGWH